MKAVSIKPRPNPATAPHMPRSSALPAVKPAASTAKPEPPPKTKPPATAYNARDFHVTRRRLVHGGQVRSAAGSHDDVISRATLDRRAGSRLDPAVAHGRAPNRSPVP